MLYHLSYSRVRLDPSRIASDAFGLRPEAVPPRPGENPNRSDGRALFLDQLHDEISDRLVFFDELGLRLRQQLC